MTALSKEQIEKADILLAAICGSKSPMGSEIAYNLFTSKDAAIHICTIIKELGLINVIRETENDPFYMIERTSTTCDYVKKGGFLANYKETESSKNQLLSSDTIKVLESLLNGNSYTITKDRPREIMDLLPKLANLDIVRKTDRYKYGANPSGRQKLKKLIELKSLKDFLDWQDGYDTSVGKTEDASNMNQNDMKRYILFFKTQSDTYNVVSIDISTLKYVIKKYFDEENDFSIGGTKYFMQRLFEFKIYEFENENVIDEFLRVVKAKKLETTTIYGESYFGKELLAKYGKDVSGAFLDASIYKKATSPMETNKKMIDIFISHSSFDKEKVKLLISILRTALSLRQEQIRCTSVAGYKLTGGTSTDEALKREIIDCKVFIGVLTENSLKSTYVLFELGARWGLGQALKPLVCEPEMSSVVKGPLTGLHCLDGSEASDIIQLVEECAEILNVKASKTDLYLEEAQKFAELSKKKLKPEISKIEATHDNQIKSESHQDINIRGVEKAVLAYAKNIYPEEYDMQEFTVNKQMEAFDKLQNPPKDWSVLPEYNSISRNAIKVYPNEYDMQLHEIEKQVKALLRLRSKKN